ncbi:MAG: response regulator, partial [Nanoarchaeota archaeon]|nr:response regulator [Nanoarchaeota archaeon]
MKKILLVDDAGYLIKAYADNLKLGGFKEIRLAYDGKEALEKILEDKPDVILTDIDMPVMDGYELCKRIRENPNISDIYIIASSGRDLPEGMENYVDEILPKGNVEELLGRLKEILGGKKNE